MTSPSVPTAEEFDKARATLEWLEAVAGSASDSLDRAARSHASHLRSTLESAEAAIERLSKQFVDATAREGFLEKQIERLSKEAARWRAVRVMYPAFGATYLTPEDADRYADDAAMSAGVSPPEPEKP